LQIWKTQGKPNARNQGGGLLRLDNGVIYKGVIIGLQGLIIRGDQGLILGLLRLDIVVVSPVPRACAVLLLVRTMIKEPPKNPRAYRGVALQVAFERQTLKPVFHLIGFRLWV
jgi:hypothetical protein